MTVDRRVSEEVLSVLSPLGIEASIAALGLLEGAHEERHALLDKQLEQTEYEARRAFEQYDEVDARNRLVAAELEARWNEKLKCVDAAKSAIAELAHSQRSLSDVERAELRSLGEHFRDVWGSPSCTPELKKTIIRTVVEEIVVSEEPAATLCFVMHWKGGTHTRFEMDKPNPRTLSRTAPEDLEIIGRMAVRYGDDRIAGVLNRLGRRTGKGKRWNQSRVATARKNHGISGRARTLLDPDILSLNSAAAHAGVSDTTIRKLVQAGLLPCQQVVPWAPWEIRRADLEAEPVHIVLEHLRRTGELDLSRGAADVQQPLFPHKLREA